jgi:mannosyltransferase
MIDIRHTILIILIVVLAAFLRFHNLGGPSLFNDELSTVHTANSDNIACMIEGHIIPDVHPPGFQIMMFFVVHHLGDNEFWLRFPTAIAGILAVLMIYFLGRYIYSSREGLIAAFLTTVLWAPLYYSQEARAYSFLLFFSIVLVFYWLKIINNLKKESPVKISWIIIFIITGILIEYFQYLGLLLLVLLGLSSIIVLIKQPKQLGKAVLIFAVTAVAFLPWLPYALDQIGRGAEWIQRPKLLAFGYYLAFLFNLSPYVLIIALLSYLILFINIIRKGFHKDNFFISKDLFLILWLILPFTVMFVKSFVSQPALTYYSLIISAPAAYLLFARGITTLNIHVRWKNVIAVIVSLFFLWQLIFDLKYYSEPYKDHFIVFGKWFNKRTKQMFREAAQYVKLNDEKYPGSIIAAYAWSPYYFNYYFDKIGFDREVDIYVLDSKDTVKFKNLSNYPCKDYIWFVRGHKEVDSAFYKWMENRFRLIHHEPMVGADVHLYKIE